MTRQESHLDFSQEHEREPNNGISFGMYLPEYVLTNNEVENWKHTNGGLVVDAKGRHITADGIMKRTGIERRYIAAPHETTLFMGEEAAKRALRSGDKVDSVFFSSSYPIGVNQATKLSHDLGLSNRGGNLEIGAACSGFVRGLTFIKERERRYQGQNILFVTSEKYSDTCADLREISPYEEPSQAQLIFSDGAVATRFTYGKDFQILSARNHSIDSDAITMPIDTSKRVAPHLCEPVPHSPFFWQDGGAVLRTVVSEVPPLIDEVVEAAGLKPEDIKFVIPHQPSRHLLESLSKRSRYTLVADFASGNFSSASIPKALKGIIEGQEMSAYRDGVALSNQQYTINPGDKVVLAGFGAGFFASVVVIEFL